MKIGLVLGGGGVTGAAWLVGALDALETTTGWQAASAHRIVGTSAGSVIGALVAAGVPPSGMAAAPPQQREGAGLSLSERLGRAYLRPTTVPRIGLGSWRLALATLARPTRHAAPVVAAGWVPRGVMSTEPIAQLVDTFAGRHWPVGGRLRVVAADYRTGRRVVFGRSDAPPAALSEAVAASCAIPGVYRPVRIDGRDYVDGGVCSPSNLDLLCRVDVDLVVCLNPMSSSAATDASSSLPWMDLLTRAQYGRRLGHEARKLREAGKKVVLLQPNAEDVEKMGANVFSGKRRDAIVASARRSVTHDLNELHEAGVALPGPSPVGGGGCRPLTAPPL